MNRKYLLLLMIVAFVGAIVVGCQDSAEESRSVITVQSINDNAPVFSDVLSDSMTVVEDWVDVTFYNRPYNGLVVTGPGMPYNEFLVSRYHIEFTRTDGSTSVPPPFDAAMTSFIESEEFGFATIKLVPAGYKTIAPLSGLVGGGSIDLIANITFYGSEVGNTEEKSFTAAVSISAANWSG